MPGYEWALLADRGGEALEGLLATLLVRRYPSARQVNPSQGDGGIDILLDTPDGLEVWQVKRFTGPLTPGQWRQVTSSWGRFNESTVAPGTQVARYHLVTPWTPTRERYADFEALTADAAFPTQWDGEAFINGLADEFPPTIERFIHGPGAFERFVTSRAMLANSPVERAEELSMMQAIDVRQTALDELRDSVSDTYYVDMGTRTVVGTDEPPLPHDDDPAVYQRMTSLGNGRWRIESIVPRSPNSAETDPISLEVQYLVEPGTPEEEPLTAWREWGRPFEDLPARTITHGGPFDGEVVELSHMSVVHPPEEFPPLQFVVYAEDSTPRLTIELRVVARTRGAETGWLYLAAETPARTLRFELRAREAGDFDLSGTVGNVDGLSPQDVLAELGLLNSVDPADTFAIELSPEASIARGNRFSPPSALEEFYRPVAEALVDLQRSTTTELAMPDVMQATNGELRNLERYRSIYNGTAHEWRWYTAAMTLSEDPEEAAETIARELAVLMSGDFIPVMAEQPVISVGGRQYLIERPLVTSRRSIRVDPDFDLETVGPGVTIPLVPGADDGVVTAAVVDWSPETPSVFG